ncbi:MAG: glycosyltransferase [Candidatus Bathyarchaeota archaeon]|nr:glycosyltransferase [Candidatus Bathyarchaeum tardum]
MLKPRVTIGICVKNFAKYVKDTLSSLNEQDFPHDLMELIIVDGYSEDNTVNVIKNDLSKTDLKFKIFYDDNGLGKARQIVVDEAVTEYIVWVDGDMILSNDFVRKQVEFMDISPKVGIAKGKCGLIEGGNLLATLEIYSRAASKMVDFNNEKTERFKSLGTSGCIYRVTAIREAGGFDENIKGYGEDLDAELRVRDVGWSLYVTDVTYQDYERYGITLNSLWSKYSQRGRDLHLFAQKNRGVLNIFKMSPPAAFLGGLFHSFTIYRLNRKKIAFLLPFQCGIKHMAWCFGFFSSQINS